MSQNMHKNLDTLIRALTTYTGEAKEGERERESETTTEKRKGPSVPIEQPVARR